MIKIGKLCTFFKQTSPMAISNIIFDFDGTLMDTAPVIIATMRATITGLGLPQRTEAEMKATIGLRQK